WNAIRKLFSPNVVAPTQLHRIDVERGGDAVERSLQHEVVRCLAKAAKRRLVGLVGQHRVATVADRLNTVRADGGRNWLAHLHGTPPGIRADVVDDGQVDGSDDAIRGHGQSDVEDAVRSV